MMEPTGSSRFRFRGFFADSTFGGAGVTSGTAPGGAIVRNGPELGIRLALSEGVRHVSVMLVAILVGGKL